MKKIIVTVYMILLCLLNGQPKDSILTYIQHFDLALDHFSKGRYQLAENEFKNILIEKRNFDDPVSHFMLAKTQFNQNKEIDCERTCNSYINKYPNSRYEVNVRMLLSDILILKEKYFEIGGFPTHLKHSTDFWIFLKLAKKYPFKTIKVDCCIHRLHENNLTNDYYVTGVQEGIEVLKTFPSNKKIDIAIKRMFGRICFKYIIQGKIFQFIFLLIKKKLLFIMLQMILERFRKPVI
mgnify:CR=1 FL=1